jgi:hypothetical protein
MLYEIIYIYIISFFISSNFEESDERYYCYRFSLFLSLCLSAPDISI